MLINEFNLELGIFDEFLADKPELIDVLNSNFYWLQAGNRVREGRIEHIFLLRDRQEKGEIKVSPNYTIVIK